MIDGTIRKLLQLNRLVKLLLTTKVHSLFIQNKQAIEQLCLAGSQTDFLSALKSDRFRMSTLLEIVQSFDYRNLSEALGPLIHLFFKILDLEAVTKN
jgi:hypothetical protein